MLTAGSGHPPNMDFLVVSSVIPAGKDAFIMVLSPPAGKDAFIMSPQALKPAARAISHKNRRISFVSCSTVSHTAICFSCVFGLFPAVFRCHGHFIPAMPADNYNIWVSYVFDNTYPILFPLTGGQFGGFDHGSVRGPEDTLSQPIYNPFCGFFTFCPFCLFLRFIDK